MKNVFILCALALLFGCQQRTDHSNPPKNHSHEGRNETSEAYKPGFGAFMSIIQIHHAKLWFAGQNENWELADFEIHEIEETIEDIEKYQSERPESKDLAMIKPQLDSLDSAIDRKDKLAFDRSYNLLTNTCNACHQITDHGFIIIKTPDDGVLSNQVFKVDSE